MAHQPNLKHHSLEMSSDNLTSQRCQNQSHMTCQLTILADLSHLQNDGVCPNSRAFSSNCCGSLLPFLWSCPSKAEEGKSISRLSLPPELHWFSCCLDSGSKQALIYLQIHLNHSFQQGKENYRRQENETVFVGEEYINKNDIKQVNLSLFNFNQGLKQCLIYSTILET